MKKVCTVCKKEKDVSEFYIRKKSRLGYYSNCKKCHYILTKSWAIKNNTRRKELNRKCHRSLKGKTTLSIWRKNNREKMNTYHKKWMNKFPGRTKIYDKVKYAKKTGLITYQPCVVCGATENTVCHHEDYSKPLNVIWFCTLHHSETHSKASKNVTI
jgi:hypothetical protein